MLIPIRKYIAFLIKRQDWITIYFVIIIHEMLRSHNSVLLNH